jgi:2-dehydro-3-deoxygluconokinase
MLRLSPPAGCRIRQATSYDATYGGAEANVAAALAQWDIDSRYVTVLPTNDLGQGAVDALRSVGVDVSHVIRDGERIGVYYLEHGASQRPSRVIYDRAHSAIAALQPAQIDWEDALAGARWFHWTGITPALSESTAAVTAEAIAVAKQFGLTVSVDLNYRGKLWSKEQARAVMTPLVEQSDVVVANEEDAANVFGIVAGKSDVDRGELDSAAYEEVAKQLVNRFGLRMAAITLRQSHSASVNTWSACLWDGAEFLRSKSYRIELVDRVGGGDAFAAGLIHGLIKGKRHAEALEFAVAASCLKQTMKGDVALVSETEIEALMGGSVAGRIRR